MSRTSYETKMNKLLSDNTTYAEHQMDPNKKLSDTNNSLVNRLHQENVVDDLQRKRLMHHNTQLAKSYALPKVHKPLVPLRPIVSTIDSPSSELSTYMVNISRGLVHDKYDVLNSDDVKRRLNNVKITRNELLVSFDVVSLFPSIPMDLVFNILKDKWTVISSSTQMSKELFFDILKFILCDATYFTFNNSIYKQSNGCAMGSCVSPIIANIVLNELLDTIIPKLPFKIKLITKYVDDILAIIPRRQVNKTLALLNSFHPRIQFTVEIENENKLPYLDMLIIREDDKILTNWYKKPTAADITLSFLSNHPLNMKCNVAFNLFYRALKISDHRFHQDNINRIHQILLDNNYPTRIIKIQLHKAQQKISNQISNPTTVSTSIQSATNITQTRCAITYDKGVSDTIKKEIKNGSKDAIQVTFKPHLPLRKSIFSKLKTKTPTLQRSNVIYKIPCDGINGTSCDLAYVGQTKNHLSTRLNQHKNDIKDNRNPNGQSAVVSHFTTLGHIPAFDKVSVLDNESHWSRRNTRESLHIFCENTYNIRRDTQNISANYCALLDTYKRRKKK